MTIDSRPWMKFRPDRWMGDDELQNCSLGAIGLWVNLMCKMHQSAEYGHLLYRGEAASDEDVALMLKRDVSSVVPLLGELESARVFSRREDGAIFSRRMISDYAKSVMGKEEVKKRGGSWGCDDEEFSDNEPNRALEQKERRKKKRKEGKKDSTELDEDEIPLPKTRKRASGCDEFDEAWMAWPQRGRSSKAKSLAIWKNRDEQPATLRAAVARYLWSKDAKKEGGEYVPALERWLRDKLDSFLEMGDEPPAGSPLAAAVNADHPAWFSEIGARIIASQHPALWTASLRQCAIVSTEPLVLRAATSWSRDQIRRNDDHLEPFLGDFTVLEEVGSGAPATPPQPREEPARPTRERFGAALHRITSGDDERSL